MLLSILWAIPWTILGLLLCMTVVLAPAGVLCIFIGCIPLTITVCVLQTKYVK